MRSIRAMAERGVKSRNTEAWCGVVESAPDFAEQGPCTRGWLCGGRDAFLAGGRDLLVDAAAAGVLVPRGIAGGRWCGLRSFTRLEIVEFISSVAWGGGFGGLVRGCAGGLARP